MAPKKKKIRKKRKEEEGKQKTKDEKEKEEKVNFKIAPEKRSKGPYEPTTVFGSDDVIV